MQSVIHNNNMSVATAKRVVLRAKILVEVFNTLPVGSSLTVVIWRKLVQMVVITHTVEDRDLTVCAILLYLCPHRRVILTCIISKRNGNRIDKCRG